MTQYTIYATAANTVGNIVTVNSVGNMFSGLPIVFSGNTFGGITAGATYYIGTVIPGYPTSTITLSSLPGGATYAVGNATGNMTAVFSSGGQQIINTVPPGESLTTAFTAVNVNFDQLFAAGPVNSNIQIANNTILTTNTNGNINLVPNGIGAVVVNSSVIPDTANIRNLGSVNNRFSTIYAQYYNMSGNLTPENINTGNLTASGYISAVGNITGNYFFGNGSQLTGVVTSTGNIGFSGDAIYDLNGIYLENADLTQGATAAVVIPTNGSSDPIQVNNTYGNIALQTGAGSGITASWSFNNDGNLQLPDAGVLWNNGGLTTLQAGNNGAQIGSNDGQSYVIANVNGTYMQTLADTTNSLWHFGTDGNLTAPGNILMSNIGGIYSTTSGYTVGLRMSNTEPSVKLVAHNHEWQFNADGVLKFPAGYSTTYPSITMGEPGNLLIQGYINGNFTEDGGNVIVSGGFGDGNNGNATVLGQQVIVQAQLSTTNGSPAYSWTFDATGNLNAPGNISASGNVDTGNINTAGSGGDITMTGGNITGVGNISAQNAEFGGNINGAGNIDIDGNGHIGGNLFVVGNINFSGNVTQISGNSGSFFGNSAGVGALYTGIPVGYSNVVTAVIQATADLNDYTQINAQNLNHGNTASMDFVITGDLGTDTTDYLDMGFSSSNWDGTQTNSLGDAVKARDGYLYTQGGSGGGNLVLGTTTAGRAIKFNVGGPGEANTRVAIDPNNGLIALDDITGGNLLTAGNVSATGNISGNYILGDGSQLTNLPGGSSNYIQNGTSSVAILSADGNATIGVNATPVANFGVGLARITGNVSANYFIGNGSQLTGLPATYGNSNVATLLSAFGSNAISTTGNISAGYLFGNASQLTGLPASYSNANVAAYLPTYSGNLNAGNIISSGNANINLDPAGTGIVAIVGSASATGNIVTAGNFVGNGAALTNVTVSVAGNIVGTQPNVSLVAGSYTYTFDNTGNLSMPVNGDIILPGANSSLSVGGAITSGGYSVPTKVAAFVNAGTFVTMDLIKATITTSGQRGLSLATTTGTLTYSIGATYALSGGVVGGASLQTQTLTTSATTSIFGWNFPNAGDTATYILTDTTNSRAYRITLQIGASFNNNMISIERLI